MPESKATAKPLDVLGILRRYALFVVVLGGLLFAMLLPGAYVLSKYTYETGGRIQISRVIPPLISQFERVSITNYFNDFAKTQVENILSSSVLEEALDKVRQNSVKNSTPRACPWTWS